VKAKRRVWVATRVRTEEGAKPTRPDASLDGELATIDNTSRAEEQEASTFVAPRKDGVRRHPFTRLLV
jgi:hypothetical protein